MDSDRTQTLSVDLERREAEVIMGVGAVSAGRPCVCGANQPAHFCHVLQDAKSKLRSALSQPDQGETPSLVLSDEDRCRLRRIADELPEAVPGVPSADVPFLRNIASQEHRGEETAVEAAWKESDRSALDELFEAITPRDGSEGDPYTAAMLAPHAWAEIKRLRSDPSTGEAARLREWLGDDDGSNWLIGPGDDGARVLDGPAVEENIAVVPEFRLLAAEEVLLRVLLRIATNDAKGEVLSAASPAYRLWDRVKIASEYFEGRTVAMVQVPVPSDSQGGQERPERYDAAKEEWVRVCDPKDHIWNEGDAGTVYCDNCAGYRCPACEGRGVKDGKGCHNCSKWGVEWFLESEDRCISPTNWPRHEDSEGNRIDPASTQGEECDGSGLISVKGNPLPGGSGVIGPSESAPCPGCRKCQGEGEGEDWPAVWVRFSSRQGLPPEASRVPLTTDARRYLPAAVSSEPSVPLSEILATANEAEDRANRAETALEELAAEYDRLETLATAASTQRSWSSAATYCREKAANLKGGEGR